MIHSIIIPPEILGHIFTFLIPGNTLSIPSNTLDTLLYVTQTCSSWRAIALQHPHLWSNLDIRLKSWSDCQGIHMARLCLGYSAKNNQPCALSILLRANEARPRDWKLSNHLQTPTFLLPHAHRIRRLSILSPLSLSSLVLPQLTDLEVLVPGFEAHPEMDIPALLQRSGSTLVRLSVGYVFDWHTILEYTPYIGKLVTEGTLTEEAMEAIAKGRLGAALREIKSTVALHDCDVFLDMIEARAPTSIEGGEVGSTCAITKVEMQCVDFSLDARQWARIGCLAPGVQFDIAEG